MANISSSFIFHIFLYSLCWITGLGAVPLINGLYHTSCRGPKKTILWRSTYHSWDITHKGIWVYHLMGYPHGIYGIKDPSYVYGYNWDITHSHIPPDHPQGSSSAAGHTVPFHAGPGCLRCHGAEHRGAVPAGKPTGECSWNTIV